MKCGRDRLIEGAPTGSRHFVLAFLKSGVARTNSLDLRSVVPVAPTPPNVTPCRTSHYPGLTQSATRGELSSVSDYCCYSHYQNSHILMIVLLSPISHSC